MKNTITTLLLITTLILSCSDKTSSVNGIQFERASWNEVLKKAKKENKIIFVDTWASWCAPCKKLSKNIFTQQEVGAYFNDNFICYKLQTDPEDSTALELAENFSKKYDITSLPALLWIDFNGEKLHHATGYMEADMLIKTAEIAKNPKANTSSILKKWSNGEHSLINGLTYFKINNKSITEFDKFFLSLTQEEQLTPELQKLILYNMYLPPESKTLKYLAQNRPEILGKDSTNTYLDRIIRINLEDAFRTSKTLLEQEEIIKEYKNYELPYLLKSRDKSNCMKALRNKDFDSFFNQLNAMMIKYPDCDFVHALTLEVGYMLEDGEINQTTPPELYFEWIEKFINRYDVKPITATRYRLIVNSFNKNQAQSEKLQSELTKLLNHSDYSLDYAESLKEEGRLLVKASNR